MDSNGTIIWLYDLGLAFLRKVPTDPAKGFDCEPWLVGCYWAAASRREALAADQRRHPWRHFLLYLEKDSGLRQSIDTVVRLGDREQAEVFVCEQLDLFVAKLQRTPVIKAIKSRQEVRARRLQCRDSGFGGFQRPTDAEFDLEALPPKVRS